MRWINPLSIPSLVAFVVILAVGIRSCILYLKPGKRLVDLLFAGLIGCGAAYCLLAVLIQNIMSPWTAYLTRADSGTLALFYYAGFYALASVAMPFQVHLVLQYTEGGNVLARKRYLLYVVFLAWLPTLWSPLFIQKSPLTTVGRAGLWDQLTCAPQLGPLVLLWIVSWVAVHVYSQVALWRYSRRVGNRRGRALTGIAFVQLGLLAAAGGGFMDMVHVCFSQMSLPLGPLFFMLSALLVAKALEMTRGEEQRRPGG